MKGRKILRRQIVWLFLRTPIVVGITSFGLGQSNNPEYDKGKNEVIDFETDGRAMKKTESLERQMFSGTGGLPEIPVTVTQASVPHKQRVKQRWMKE